MNAIKNYEIALNKAVIDANLNVKKIQESVSLFSDAITKANGTVDSIVSNLAKSNEHLKQIEICLTQANSIYSQAKDVSVQTDTYLKAIQNTDGLIKTIHAETVTANATTKDILSKSKEALGDAQLNIKEMHETIGKMNASTLANNENITSALEQHQKEVDGVLFKLRAQQKDIDDKLQKATGISLFHAFGQRQKSIFVGKMIWGGISGLLLIAMVWYNAQLIDIASKTEFKVDTAFWLRVALNTPFAIILGFASVQYSRERKLEEEYAFKSNISVSLEAYREIVDRLLKDEKEASASANGSVDQARTRLVTFIIESIQNIFSSPTERVFGDHKKEVSLGSATKELKAISEAVAPFLKNKKEG